MILVLSASKMSLSPTLQLALAKVSTLTAVIIELIHAYLNNVCIIKSLVIFFNLFLLAVFDNCYDIVCPPWEEDCPVGSYYEPGAQLPGDCCPALGVCVCDAELCPEPECPEDSIPFIVAPADERDGECCNQYACKPGKRMFIRCVHVSFVWISIYNVTSVTLMFRPII